MNKHLFKKANIVVVHFWSTIFILATMMTVSFAQDIDVTVSEGIVYIDGYVDSESDIVKAEEAIKEYNKDLKIVNSLRVSNEKNLDVKKYEEKAKEEGASEPISETGKLGAELGTKIRLALKQNLSGASVGVRQLDGERMVVEGKVNDEEEKEKVLQDLAQKNDIVVDKLKIGEGKNLNDKMRTTLWIIAIGFVLFIVCLVSYIYIRNKDKKEYRKEMEIKEEDLESLNQ